MPHFNLFFWVSKICILIGNILSTSLNYLSTLLLTEAIVPGPNYMYVHAV